MNGLKNTSLVLGFGGLAFLIWGFVELNTHLGRGADIAKDLVANSSNITQDYIAIAGTAFSILGVETGWDYLLIALGLGLISIGIACYAIYVSVLTDRRVGRDFALLQQTITQQCETIATKLERLEDRNEKDQDK
jgi:hypothetical protein